MKKIITTVLLVVLIVAAFSILSAPHVKAQTSQAKILSYTWYTAPADTVLAGYIGDLVAVGEIQNVDSNVINYVDITAFAYSSNGTVLNTGEGQAYGNNLLPSQKAPFYIDFDPTSSVTGDNTYTPLVTNVTVEVTYVGDTNSTPYSGLTIPTGGSTSFLDNTGTYTVTGTIDNTGTQKVTDVFVVTTFYNASGSVLSFNYTNYLSDPLGSSSLTPGDTMSFTATPTDNTAQLSSEIANYSLLIQSSPLTPSTSTPSPPTPTPTSIASTQPTQSPTLPAPALTYGIAGAIVVIVVALVVLMLFRKRQKNAQFEPPPPPPPPPPS